MIVDFLFVPHRHFGNRIGLTNLLVKFLPGYPTYPYLTLFPI